MQSWYTDITIGMEHGIQAKVHRGQEMAGNAGMGHGNPVCRRSQWARGDVDFRGSSHKLPPTSWAMFCSRPQLLIPEVLAN